MMIRRALGCGASALALVLIWTPATPMAQGPAGAAESALGAKIWVGRHAEMEEALTAAEIDRCEQIGLGVTAPLRCWLSPGQPVESFAWKKVHGRHLGFWDSYRAEIAAYELDKLLDLDMVPPTVEKRVRGDLGGAMLWVAPATMWNIEEPISGPNPAGWARQIVRMKMFDNLIGNTDRNQGNLLVDPAHNLILIDHSRGFTAGRRLVARMNRVDPELWERMQALTLEKLEPVLRPWIGRGQIRDILRRRDQMQKEVDRLVAERGDLVFIR